LAQKCRCEADFALTTTPSDGHIFRVSGIGVVINPKSRRNLRDPGAALRLARQLGDHGVVRSAHSIDELYRIAEDFRRDRIDVLAISGGDGTNHVTLTGFIDVYGGHVMPQVALLRGGTMNTVANSVGVRHGKPEGLLGRLIRDYAHRASMPLENVERHVMRITPEGGDGKAHYGFLFGTGVVAGYLSEYYAGGEPTPLVAAQTLFRGIGSALVGGEMIRRMARPFRGTVTMDDGTRWDERDYLAIAAGTIANIGLNFRPFHRYDEQPGRFHVLGIHASPVAFVKELPRIHRAQPMRPGKAYDAVSCRMVVRGCDDVVKYMIDGDLHETRGELHVSMGPRVRLVVMR
jgi:diacylglycerol kinase family enzyme